MSVSKYQRRQVDPDREAAVSWLQRQLAWEQVLNRLRLQAGVGAGRGPEVPAAA